MVVSPPKALVFDVFGTVVDWRSALLAAIARFARSLGRRVDPGEFLHAWERARRPAMDAVNAGAPWRDVSAIYRERLDHVLVEYGLETANEAARDELNRAWTRPNVWPDTLAGLRRLKGRFVLATLTNCDFAWAVAMAKNAGLPWDCVITAENVKCYKPAPENYRLALDLLGLRPEQAMMVACHNYDLRAAQGHGLRTAFLPRKEFSDDQTKDQAPEGDWDVVARDLVDLADRLGA